MNGTTTIDTDLQVARDLILAGIPLFLAYPDDSKTGFVPPPGWQDTLPCLDVVDEWRPGLALCAVMGHGLDLIDIDPRNGGEIGHDIDGIRRYAVAATPSGGVHLFIASLGVGSRDNLYPGVDIKGGRKDGTGRGFAFIAPTVRRHAVTGVEAKYVWHQAPNLKGILLDDSGAALAAHLRMVIGHGVQKAGGPSWWKEFVTSNEPQSQAAADRAIDSKLADVRDWQGSDGGGFRNVLLRAALTLGGYVGGGYLDESDAWGRLESGVAEVWGSPNEDDRLWIEQGLTDGATQPFHVYTVEDEILYGEAAQIVAATRSNPSRSIQRTLKIETFDPRFANHDQEYAEEVLTRTVRGIRYAADTTTWLTDDGRGYWMDRPAKANIPGFAVTQVARLMPLGDPDVPKKIEDRTEAHWQALRRKKFMSSSGRNAIADSIRALVAGGDHPSALELADLDSEPEVLWAGGIPWDLRASRSEPVPANLSVETPHLHSALCKPVLTATPNWDHFVACVWPDPAVRAWALRVLSIALAGYPDAALPILFGPERTGKTALITLLMDVLGSYGHSADPRLLGNGDNMHPSAKYALKGRRLSFIDEGPRRGVLAAERLKQLTGGGPLTGHKMNSNPVTFHTTHTLVMTTNDEPPITDPALKARMRIIPCDSDQTAVRLARRAITPAVWVQEAPGVLAFMMSECAAWLADQDSAAMSAAPAVILGEAEEIALGQNSVAEWVEMRTVPSDPGTAASELYENYCQWYQEQARFGKTTPVSMTAWGRSLNDLGYPGVKNQGPRRQTYRPLSVFGPGYVAPWEPSGPSANRVGSGPNERVGEGRENQPTRTQTPSSAPLFSLEREGERVIPPYKSIENKYIKNMGDDANTASNREKFLTHSESRQINPADLRKGGDSGLSADSLTPTPSVTGTTRHEGEPALSRKRAEIAAYAHDRKLTKAQARAELKEAARLEAIAEAQGPLFDLPCVVDRAGNIVELQGAQPAFVLDKCLQRTQGALTVDVETSGYPVGHHYHQLRSVQLGDETASVVLDPIASRETIQLFLDKATKLHAHSASADLVPLAAEGLISAETGWAKMYDTVIPARLGDPRSTGSDPGLKKLSAAVLGNESVAPAAEAGREAVFKAGKWLTKATNDTPRERNGWSQIETRCEAMVRYAASDVLDTAALAKRLPPVAPAVMERERITEEMTARVAHRGLKLDHHLIMGLWGKHTLLQAAAHDSIVEFGVHNPSSGKQLAEKLTEMGAQLPISEKGNPSVAEHVLTTLGRNEGAVGALARLILEYRHSSTVLNLFLAPYRHLCELGDGRARPTVYSLGTDTGRMSCVRPNFQQLPREGGIRAVVRADDGMCLISADFSGVELRGAAALSQDQTMMHMIREEDAGRFDGFHWALARAAFGPEATKAHRYTAKRGVFGHIYGGGVATLARQVGVPEEEMAAIVDSLKTMTPGLAQWSDQMRVHVRAGRTEFPSYSGRIIHFPREFPHKAPNYAIQGSCRELLVDALIKWRDTTWGECTVLPIHDELIVQVPIEDAHDATRALVQCMESELYGVKIVADPGKEDEWGSTYWRDAA